MPVSRSPAVNGRRLPVTVRDGGPASVSLERPAAQPGHLGASPGLVDKDQALRIEIYLAFEPEPTAGEDVRALLLR